MESQTPSPEHSVPRALGGCCKGQRRLSDAATVLSPVVKVDNERLPLRSPRRRACGGECSPAAECAPGAGWAALGRRRQRRPRLHPNGSGGGRYGHGAGQPALRQDASASGGGEELLAARRAGSRPVPGKLSFLFCPSQRRLRRRADRLLGAARRADPLRRRGRAGWPRHDARRVGGAGGAGGRGVPGGRGARRARAGAQRVRGPGGAARPLLGRARPPAPLHPGLRERRLRQGGARVQHLRPAARALLRAERARRGAAARLPPLQRVRPAQGAPARLPHRPPQSAQPHVLAVRDLPAVPAQRHAHAVAGQEVRGDVREPPVLLAAARVHGHLQVHGLRAHVGALPVLLHAVPPDVQPAAARAHRQAERAGGRVHRLAHRHAAAAGRPHRLQHAGRAALGARLRQLAGAAGLGHGHRHPRGLQPPAHVRGRERGRPGAGARLVLLRRVRPAGGRPLQVQRPRGPLRARPRRRRPGVRLPAPHGGARVRPLQALPLRPALAARHGPRGQRVRGLQLQPARPALPLQHGALQAVGAQERGRLPQLPPQHGRPPLPLLQGGLLPRHGQAHHPPEGLQSLRLPPRGCCWQNLQPNHRPVSLQGRRDRHHLQPLRQGLPAEPLPHRPLHQDPRGAAHHCSQQRGGAGRLRFLLQGLQGEAEDQHEEVLQEGLCRADPHPEGGQGGGLVEVHGEHHLRVQAGRQPHPAR